MLLGATSCTDFLTLYPQDRIVEENFWEDKNDLNGVRYAAYQQMGSTINKFIIWGDVRSDNYQINRVQTNAQGSRDTYMKMVEAKLDTTMSEFDWGGVYTTINYCNKVLAHGEEVLAKDPQFTSSEWAQMKAEMIALRAMNYFYLLRAFKDIPYSTKVINTDEEVEAFPATNQLAVLDTLIHDVRAIAGKAVNRYPSSSDSHGMLTNSAIYALLAEMYLWRNALREGRGLDDLAIQDCDSVIEFGQRAIDVLANVNQLTQTSSMGLTGTTKTSTFDSGISNALMITNEDMTGQYNAETAPDVDSYDAIFSTSGNSLESIFELQYSMSDNRKSDYIYSFYGRSNGTHFEVSNNAISKIYPDDNTMKKDSRTWYSCQNYVTESSRPLDAPYMLKWNNCRFLMADKTTVRADYSSSEYHNWIFYRLTDVMLMMAEAYAAKAKGNTVNDADVKACKAIVDAVHKRSTVGEMKLSSNDHKDKNSCIKLVMDERQIEFLGEGKRWFDLVRYAERYAMDKIKVDDNGDFAKTDAKDADIIIQPDPREPQYVDGTMGVRKMITDYLVNAYPSYESAYKSRIKNRYGLYCPVYYMEIRANRGKIQQNPVWNREK